LYVLLFLILSPFLVAPLAAWIGARAPRWSGLVALWPALLAAVFGGGAFLATGSSPVVDLDWASPLGLTLSFNLDGLGLLFATLITGIGALVLLYASAYLRDHRDLWRFEAFIFIFMGAMLGVVLSDNLYATFVFWELTGFSSFLLIGFDFERREARAAAQQALIVTGAGGLGLLAAAALLEQVGGSVSVSTLIAAAPQIQAHALYPAIVALVLFAAFTKSAQVPFHFWLPGAMAAPTPVSAYLHSATMVKAGIYLIARMTPVLGGTSWWTTPLIVAGAATLAAGAWRAHQETDLKRILAYSTVSALGVIVLLLGIGTPGAVAAALVYLVAHACYKGALFMIAGAIDHETGTRDVTRLGGLYRKMPIAAAAGTLAAASMLGLPLFFGFYGKELLYDALLQAAPLGATPLRATLPAASTLILIAIAVVGSALLGAAGLRAGLLPFAGRTRSADGHVHEPPAALWLGPVVLGITGLALALAPQLIEGRLGAAASAITRDAQPLHLALWHGFTPVLGLSALTIALAAALYVLRSGDRRATWPWVWNTARVYTGVVSALDRVSATAAPAMQSGSLRSYVLVMVVTVGSLVGAALFLGGGGWMLARSTAVRPHDIIIAAVICAAAITAARCSDSMTAVICLGTVGYGVALTFMFFGAPDLAMTQFSVETLTVVIFVLVFRHFGDFGSTSPPLVRWRDAIIAGAFGSIFATLTLLVGSSGSVSRLSAFFADAAPRLAHGRNIVNVILVDFRALDTLGEITVLVTAAIGVQALLRINAQNRGRR
jgi:multicomponent Na+:H+ antiporter subunit A